MNNNILKEMVVDLYSINYMMFYDIDFEDYKEVILSNIFLWSLESLLEENIKNNLYTEEMYQKLGKLIEYINSNIETEETKNITNLYNMLKEYPSYEFYNNEFLLKYDLINDDLKNKIFVWNKKEIEKSIKDDYIIILYLNLDFEKFKEIYSSKYTGNINYLLFLNKFIKLFPNLLFDKKYKEKILYTLEYNKKLENKSEMFTKMNDSIYNKVTNFKKKDINRYFNLDAFEQIYYDAMFEKMIVLNEKVDIDYTNPKLLNNLYNFIDEYDSIFNVYMKNNLINIMDRFKNNIKDLNLKEYNEYLIKVNSMDLSENKFIINYLLNKNINKKNELIEILKNPYLTYEYLELINLDFNFLESLLCNNEEFEKYMEHFIYSDDYMLTIERYLKECPLMFKNKEISDRVIRTLKAIMNEYEIGNLNSKNYYKQHKKLLKKLEKGKY